MNAFNNTLDYGKIHDLVLVLAGLDTTIADYLAECDQLWSHPEHRVWLTAALIRKAATVTEEPDVACIEFVGRKAYEALDLEDSENGPSKEEFVQLLPAVIRLIPGEVWTKPWTLWEALLNALMKKYGITISGSLRHEPIAIDSRTRELAALFADSVGSAWTKALDDRLEAWKDRPSYTWLIALRRAKRLDTLIETTIRQTSATNHFSEFRLLDKLGEMSPAERRDIIDALDLHDLASELSKVEDLISVQDYIAGIYGADRKIGGKLCSLLDLPILASRLERTENLADINNCLSAIHIANPRVGRRLCLLLDLQKLARKLSRIGEFDPANDLIETIHKISRRNARRLCALLEFQHLARKLSQPKDYVAAMVYISTILKVNPDAAQKLCAMLYLHELAQNLRQIKDSYRMVTYRFVCVVREANPAAGNKLQELVHEK